MPNGPFTPGNGRIAADLFDFRKHVNGTDFIHTAAQITNSPGVGDATTVQESIENINDFIASLAGAGTAFIAIPDGYDSYIDPAPNFYFSNTIPPLDDFLIPLFAAIVAGTGIPAGYERLADGGIIYIPAGVYYISTVVDIPPGIILLGEGFATQIINATAMNLVLSPPRVDGGGTPTPMFRILADTDRLETDSVIDDVNIFMYSRVIKILNLTIADNFVTPTSLGDVYYKLPQNSTGDNPLILQYQGSSLELHDVYFIGRALVDETDVTEATRFAIKLDTATPVTSSHLKMTNCFIDGFSVPIVFNSTAGIEDYLEVSDCKIRAHGWLDGDDTSVDSNCIINANDGNAKISNNTLVGNHSLLLTIMYVDAVIAGSVPIQSYSKVLIYGNTFTVDKEETSSITTFGIQYNASIVSTVLTKLVPIVYGNNQGNGFQIATSLNVNTNSISADYVVDSTVLDIVIFANTTTAALTVTLPVHRAGRKLIIKDIGGNASINNITVARNGSTGTIDDYTGSRIIANDWGSLSLVSNGTNWYIV